MNNTEGLVLGPAAWVHMFRSRFHSMLMRRMRKCCEPGYPLSGLPLMCLKCCLELWQVVK